MWHLTKLIWYKIRGLKSKSGLLTTELVGGGVETFFSFDF